MLHPKKMPSEDTCFGDDVIPGIYIYIIYIVCVIHSAQLDGMIIDCSLSNVLLDIERE